MLEHTCFLHFAMPSWCRMGRLQLCINQSSNASTKQVLSGAFNMFTFTPDGVHCEPSAYPITPAVSQSIHPYDLFTIDGQALVGEQLHGRPVFASWLKKHATTGKGSCMYRHHQHFSFRFWAASYDNASRSIHRSGQAEVVRHDTNTLGVVYGLGRCPR